MAKEKRQTYQSQAASQPRAQVDEVVAVWARIEQEDRQRLSAKVHNELQQYIAAARMHVGLALQQRPETAGSHVDEILHLLDECVEASRALTLDLFPRVLNSGSFAAAMEWLAKSLQARYSVQIRTQICGQASPQPHVAFAAFRAVHEALVNVAQHAGVHEAALKVDGNGQWVRITITDAGSGFDPAKLDAPSIEPAMLPLRIARDRVRAAGGSVDIQSAPGSGTMVSISVPAEGERGSKS